MKDRNENRPGYKKTKVGWIPERWECIHLSDIAYVQTGLAKNKKSLRASTKLPYLRVANVQDGFLHLEEIKEIEIGKANIERYLLQIEDVLFTEGGDFDKLGRGTIWHGEIKKCLHQNHIFAVRCNKKRILPYFLSSLASGTLGRRYFMLCSKQSTNLASINSSQLKAFPLPTPPLTEQKKIAEILSTWDTVIDQTRQLIEAKKRRKKGLMQQLLWGKKRLPRFSRKWKIFRLEQLFKQVSRPVNFDDQAIYSLLSVRRRSGGFFLRGKNHGHTILTKKLYTVKTGDFIISKMQVVHGATAVVDEEYNDMHISGSYIALRASDPQKVNMSFVKWLSKTPFFYHLTYLASYGVHIEKMTFNLRLFLKSRINIPEDIEEQVAIADVLQTADDEINQLEAKLKAMEKQKRGLMQKLLTGEIRVAA